MSDSKWERDKLTQCKIGGPSKPYVDRNLQIHLPCFERPSHLNQTTPSPIYSHYIGSSPSNHNFSPVNEAELLQAMSEAEKSFEAWKKMQKKIQKLVEAQKN